MVMFDNALLTKLPQEVRKIIFRYVLANEKPILPHLCDKEGEDGEPRFHDDNSAGHASIFVLTSLTRVSKKLREESLPVFYSKNSFAVGPDTSTYFAYLESMGRLDWILRVNLTITSRSEVYAALILRFMNQFDREAESHKRNACVPTESALSSLQFRNDAPPATSTEAEANGDSYEKKRPLSAYELRQHPLYQVGGCSDLNLAILLRMLSTLMPLESRFRSRVVLPVSNASAFDIDSGLRWFPKVVQGLGMELRFVERPDTASLQDRMVLLEWNRKYQGQDIVTVAGPQGEPGKDVMKRALEMFPHLEEMRRPRLCCYYRRSCYSGSITWYDVRTMGGGR